MGRSGFQRRSNVSSRWRIAWMPHATPSIEPANRIASPIAIIPKSGGLNHRGHAAINDSATQKLKACAANKASDA